MNEQIRALAEQTFFDETTSQPSDKMYTFSEHKMQQFAELIVRECAQFIFVLDAEPVSHKSAARMLQEHFGIE